MTDSPNNNPYAVPMAMGPPVQRPADQSAARLSWPFLVLLAVGASVLMSVFTQSSRYSAVPTALAVFGGLGLQVLCVPFICVYWGKRLPNGLTSARILLTNLVGWMAYCAGVRLQMMSRFTTEDVWLLGSAICISMIITAAVALWLKRLSKISAIRTELSDDAALQ